MKYIEIEGERIEVHGCGDCPCFDHGEDGRYGMCRHPSRSVVRNYYVGGFIRTTMYVRKPMDRWLGDRCPLREV